MGAKYTEAQKRAAEKYKAAHTEQLKFDIPKGCRDKYKAYAKSRGMSLTKLFMELIDNDMQKNGFVYDDIAEN